MTLVIRRTEPSDYEALRHIFTHPSAVWGTLQMPFPSAESWRKRLAETPDGLYSLVACAEDEVVGQLSLHLNKSPRRRHVGQLGMAVREDWQGRGVGTALMEAAIELSDRWLNLRRLELEVYTDNEPAIRLYKKFGFDVEGTRVDFAFRDGAYVDAYMMARLRRE
ncbi:MAG: GNAT family N-acetyltransferase [Elainellaceae cyanobacterium]